MSGHKFFIYHRYGKAQLKPKHCIHCGAPAIKAANSSSAKPFDGIRIKYGCGAVVVTRIDYRHGKYAHAIYLDPIIKKECKAVVK